MQHAGTDVLLVGSNLARHFTVPVPTAPVHATAHAVELGNHPDPAVFCPMHQGLSRQALLLDEQKHQRASLSLCLCLVASVVVNEQSWRGSACARVHVCVCTNR